jgi:hypothetical protein
MFHPVACYLRQQGWKEWTLAQIQTDALVWWIFRPGEALPAIVGKLPRTKLDSEIARREADALRQLDPAAAGLGIPRLLFDTELDGGRFLFLQSAVPGQPVLNDLPSLPKAAGWLERFQSSVRAQGSIADALCDGAARCSAILHDLSAQESGLLELARRLAAESAALPAVPVHGDFWAGNVLESRGQISVIDWSNYRSGSPIEDLCNFAAAIPDTKDNAQGRMRRMWDVFFADTPLMRATRDGSLRMLAARGYPQESLRAVFVLFLMARTAGIEFSNHAAWRLLVARYMDAGAPPPFGRNG